MTSETHLLLFGSNKLRELNLDVDTATASRILRTHVNV